MSESRGGDDYNISASQVKSHAKCPRQWWFKYRSDKEATKQNDVYLKLGSRVHEAIEDVLTAESPPPLTHEEAVQAAIQNQYAEKDEYPLPDDHFSDGMDYCETAAGYLADRAENGVKLDGERAGELEVRDIEIRWEYEINREGVETGVTAIMDVIAEPGVIIDWKTGRIRDETPHEEKIQGAIYMAAYFDKYGSEPESIKFIYVKEGKVRSIDPSDDIWEYMLKRARALVEAKESGEFAGDPGSHCYWCDFEFHCPDAPCGMGNVPPEEY